ncbi:MAG: ribosome silencing factor [Gemmatimonadota bacterium]
MPTESEQDPTRGRTESLNESQLTGEVSRALDLALDRKGRDIAVLDLRGLSSATDFFLLATGTSDIHVRSIAEHIVEELKKEDVRPNHVEGLQGGRWVLIDYIDFVVHVFHPAARDFYELERLWGDAPLLAVES